jgi:hypothetical protein
MRGEGSYEGRKKSYVKDSSRQRRRRARTVPMRGQGSYARGEGRIRSTYDRQRDPPGRIRLNHMRGSEILRGNE